MLDIKTFPNNDRDFILELNSCLSRLSKRRKPSIRALEKSDLTPKILWKINCLTQGFIYRSVDLAEGASNCWNSHNQLSAILLSRGLLETLAAIHDFYHNLSKTTENKDFAGINSLVMAWTFARAFSSTEKQTENVSSVMTLIDKLDIHFLNDRKAKRTRKIYDVLSNHSHPNYLGTVGFFGNLDQKKHEHLFNTIAKDSKLTSNAFTAGFASLLVFENLLKKIELLLPPIAALSSIDQAKN